LALLVVAALLLLSGCHGSAVSMSLPPGAQAQACTTLGAALPHTVLGHARRTTKPASPALAAWGDPAIILRCGVAAPGPSTDCESVNGVDWVVTQLSNGVEFTTFGRTPSVEVLVPSRYAPEAFALTSMSTPVAAIAQTRHCTA
jgi:hypothetical protein